ncbi:hypothetical protein M501DRAFT_1018663 [Patellaria atrata CBS 101060]|uniref:Uncharacterized protein n=1 Tax=Patellaria atrata CBS 101060 TaxID=1346257 RepID=A0A9P4S6T9_9PEZI|nr:hypothetical protein M501DRAFT_1018663 [Patellaria atrata CBS 101060]
MDLSELGELSPFSIHQPRLVRLTGLSLVNSIFIPFKLLWRSYKNSPTWRAGKSLIQNLNTHHEKLYVTDILALSRSFGTSDSRDHVFAFIDQTTARTSEGEHLFTINYTKFVDRVYFEVACAILRDPIALWTTLSSVDHTGEHISLHSSRPSWVPRWNDGLFVNTLRMVRSWYCAGGSGSSFSAKVLRERFLQLRSILFDAVAWVSPALEFFHQERRNPIVETIGYCPEVDEIFRDITARGFRTFYEDL